MIKNLKINFIYVCIIYYVLYNYILCIWCLNEFLVYIIKYYLYIKIPIY